VNGDDRPELHLQTLVRLDLFLISKEQIQLSSVLEENLCWQWHKTEKPNTHDDPTS